MIFFEKMVLLYRYTNFLHHYQEGISMILHLTLFIILGIVLSLLISYTLVKAYGFNNLLKIEIVNGAILSIVFIFLFLKKEDLFLTLKYGIFFSILLLISYVDFKSKIIPNIPLLLIGILGISLNLFYFDYNYTFSTVFGFIVFAIILTITHIFSKGSIGTGDVKLISLSAFVFGLSQIMSILIITFLISASIGIFLILFRKKDSKSLIPFAPIILAGYSFCLTFNFI